MNCDAQLCFIYYSNIGPRCVLHIGSSISTEKIIPFTEQTLQKCFMKKAIRDENSKKKSKYDAIKLPQSVDGIVGYHATCFRYYCSVSKKKDAIQTETAEIPQYLIDESSASGSNQSHEQLINRFDAINTADDTSQSGISNGKRIEMNAMNIQIALFIIEF